MFVSHMTNLTSFSSTIFRFVIFVCLHCLQNSFPTFTFYLSHPLFLCVSSFFSGCVPLSHRAPRPSPCPLSASRDEGAKCTHSDRHTHTFSLSTQGLAPTQETNFQFTVEWEISLPPASTISHFNLEGQSSDSSWGAWDFMCVCVCVQKRKNDTERHTRL